MYTEYTGYVSEYWDMMQNAFITVDCSLQMLESTKCAKSMHVAPHLPDTLPSLSPSFIHSFH